MRESLLKAVVLTLLALLAVPVAAAERVALVIGNGAYADRPLRNPVNDAADLATALERLGFQVLRYTDLDRKGMHRALQAFREALRGTQLGLFYYAGHGAQHHGRNYLIPVRAEIKDAADLPVEALEADSVLAQMQSAGNAVSVVILDACRNLPYPGADRAGERGLARPDATIRGSLVAYATGPGSVALDGDGRNSPYAAALLAEIGKPGVTLTELFNNVAWAVARATNNAQEPWYSTSPLPKIYLAQESVPSPFRPSVPQEAPAAGSRLQPGQVFRDTLSDGTRGPAMVVIPAGEFWMGLPENHECSQSDVVCKTDRRRHRVSVGTFAIGQYEVTVGEFQRFVGASGYKTDAERNAGKSEGCYIAYWEEGTAQDRWKYGDRAGLSWRNPNFKQDDDHPVVCVSWNDAVVYTEWLSQQTGQTYRLPTEAEWEYAARAGTTGARYWGDDLDQTCQYANTYGQTSKQANDLGQGRTCDDRWAQTAPVGSFQPNAWKLYDMLGNVFEWTCSEYDTGKDYDDDGAETKCTDRNKAGERAMRGGSWDYTGATPSDQRYGSDPTYRSHFQGFRLARSL